MSGYPSGTGTFAPSIVFTCIECVACRPFSIAIYDTVGAVSALRVRKLTDAKKQLAAEAAGKKD